MEFAADIVFLGLAIVVPIWGALRFEEQDDRIGGKPMEK